MEIRNLKAKVVGPVLLLLPMTCMQFGDGHHDGGHHSSIYQPPAQSLRQPGTIVGQREITILQDSQGRK